MDFQLHPMGDRAVIMEFGTDISPTILKKIQNVTKLLEDYHPMWLIEYIPAFTTITILYDPITLSFREVCQQIKELVSSYTDTTTIEQRVVDIPVCYGGEMGPDLEYVAESNDLTCEEVIQIHSSGDYLVYMIGFAPGFPYIGGMSERIATPRKEIPRLEIPERSVGIAGLQTGIYPISTPGGWQLIGRTPIELFIPNEKQPSLLRAGDKINFIPITGKEYEELEKLHYDYST